MDADHCKFETNALLSSIADNRKFSSGEPVIDAFFHEKAEQSDAEFHTQTTLMFAEHNLVGFYSSSVRTFEIRYPDFKDFVREEMLRPEELDAMETGDELSYPAINLQYFAINQNRQRNGLGRIMMRTFLSEIAAAYLDHGLGFSGVFLYALPDAVIFYQKSGFRVLNGIDFENGPDLQQYPMFLSTKKVLDYYAEG